MSILDLPLDLSRDSPAWTPDGATLYTGLADYVRRCEFLSGWRHNGCLIVTALHTALSPFPFCTWSALGRSLPVYVALFMHFPAPSVFVC